MDQTCPFSPRQVVERPIVRLKYVSALTLLREVVFLTSQFVGMVCGGRNTLTKARRLGCWPYVR